MNISEIHTLQNRHLKREFMVFYPENGIEKPERRLSSTRKKNVGNKGGAPESTPSTLRKIETDPLNLLSPL